MSDVTLTGEPGPIELDKRTYIPGYTLTWTCTHCGNPCTRDFGDHYLSYPTANGPPETVHLWCPECDFDDDTIQVKVALTLELG